MPDAPDPTDPSVRDATLRKMDAEIAKLLSDTHRHDDKVGAEIAKLIAETHKLNTESRWYLLAVGSGFTLAIVALTRLVFQ